MDKEELFENRKKKIYELMQDKLYQPMKEKELAVFMDVAKEDRHELRMVLRALMDENKIEVNARGKYKVSAARSFTGTFVSNAKGFGFVEVEGLDEDLFIPGTETNGAYDSDIVDAELIPSHGKRQEARIVNIVKRGISQIVGVYTDRGNGRGYVTPDNAKLQDDIQIDSEDSMGAVTGHKVLVEILDYGDDISAPTGRVSEILGHINDPGVDILSIIKGHEIPVDYPEDVMKQVEGIEDKVSEAEKKGRENLRAMQMVTIDGEDSKDLDDAVSVSFVNGIYKLGVHIADVSNYVTENSPLDKEALERGTSVYMVDRVIPMLPHKLSNGICSLNEGQDRLALSCLMDIDENGGIVDYRIVESLICSNRRMTYTSVQKIIEDNDPDEIEKYKELVPMFRQMAELADILHAKREKRGSINFDFPETKVTLNEKGEPVDIRPYPRNTATDLIEEFMLAANETVAEHFYWLEVPFLYRTHEHPEPEKVEELDGFLKNFGYHMKAGRDGVTPGELQRMLDKVKGKPEESLFSTLILRSLKRARYTTECMGHFGLACKYYCHFTSPIRRYPDLQIHRIIKEQLCGKLKGERTAHYDELLGDVAKHTSAMERRADEAERDTVKMKEAQFMMNHVGEEYDGVISGVTGWGIYVQLPSTIEGLVHISKLPGDYFVFDEKTYRMVGSRKGTVYSLGQPVRILVAGVDAKTNNIDFDLVIEENEKQPTKAENKHKKIAKTVSRRKHADSDKEKKVKTAKITKEARITKGAKATKAVKPTKTVKVEKTSTSTKKKSASTKKSADKKVRAKRTSEDKPLEKRKKDEKGRTKKTDSKQ